MRFPALRLVLFLVALALAVAAFVVRANQGPPDIPCISRTFEGQRFIVCTYDARRHDLRLASRGANGGFMRGFAALATALGPDARRVRFAMNAGMFNDDGAPIGLYVENHAQGQGLRLTEGPGNFHMKPNGVFWQGDDGGVHVTTSDAYAALAPAPRLATQSGPMLVINNATHPRFSADGTSRLLRNGVGVRDDHVAYFVISGGPVSFGRFARFFRDDLHCPNALFLDGSVSSLWARNLRRRDDAHLIGPMVVVLDRRR